MKEASVVNIVMREMRRAGCSKVRKMAPGGGWEVGDPDIIGCWQQGRLWLVETKRPAGGKLEPIQSAKLQGWRKAGALAYVDWDGSLTSDVADGLTMLSVADFPVVWASALSYIKHTQPLAITLREHNDKELGV